MIGESGLGCDDAEFCIGVFDLVKAPFESAVADVSGDGEAEFGAECSGHVTGVDSDFLTQFFDVYGFEVFVIEGCFELG